MPRIMQPAAKLEPLTTQVARAERAAIVSALEANGGCVAAAARSLGLPISTMRHKLRVHAIDLSATR